MKKNKLQKLLNNLDKNTEICKKIDSNIKDINQNIKYAPTDIINSFKTYTEPQTNILKIIEFYKITIYCTQRIDDEMKNIHTITERSLIRAIQAHYNIKNELAKLEEYYEFNVIAKLRDKTNKQIHNIVEIVFHSFFKGFERGGDANELKVMSRFLLENDESEYMLKYVKVMFYKYSARNYAKDGDRVMKSLKNLKNTFGEIHTINVAYMSDAKAELLDKQIQQMLVVEYKDIIGKILMNLEHKYKDRNIVDACNWYLALRDKDIASLFVEFDDEILTVIFNLQIQFTNNIDSLRKPNKKLLNEDFIFNLFKVLNLFENPDLHKFFDLFGTKLDYKNYEEMKFLLGSTALDKIFDLSKSLKGIQKNIYLLNNIHLMATYCKEYQGTRIAEYIDRLCNEIVKMWKDQCDKRKGDATEFLNVNFEIQKDYYLPEEIRTLVTERINKIVMDMLERCRYKDGKDMLELRLHELFRGK